ncbi:MAG: DUF1553 domain-containing protein [Planctomycetota bacterium]|nr:DUF1553 domain-containing protein [Planctomycetota bacterium]
MKIGIDRQRESHRTGRQAAMGMVLAASLLTLFPIPAMGAEPLSYNRDIRPILSENCFSCHGADSAARKAELRLDHRELAIESGAILAGKPKQSELVARIFSSDPDQVMPPPESKKQLSNEQKQLLKRWIAGGAGYEAHWSFIAPTSPRLPSVRNRAWAKNGIDHFVLEKLQARGLSPAPQADPHTLFRRLHLDITGLPPSPDNLAAFAEDFGKGEDTALSDWIDVLMESTAWGEHRGRYWLDAARYGDTHGLHFDNYREMWPYRDWVIRAFNANQPFDQFTLEQLAGDLLPTPSDDQLVATGFQRCNITTNEGGTIDEETLALYAADRVQTIGWVFLGMTTNCSQCHDHKFDPFSTKDYYSMAAFFRNTTQGAKDRNVKEGGGPTLLVPNAADLPRWNAIGGELAAAVKKREERRRTSKADFEKWLDQLSTESPDENLPVEGLLVHLPLNEGTGNEAKNLGPGPATFPATGNISWNPDGKIGPAPVMKAGGTFDLGGLGNFERDQAFSYGAWIKTVNNKGSGGIIARMDEKADYRGWDLWQNGAGFAVHIIHTWPTNAIKVTTEANVVRPGTWQHVLATYDGSGTPAGIRIYIDGTSAPLKVDQGSLGADATIRTATPLRVGQRSHTQVFSGGAIQDVRIFNRLLSAVEVKAIAGSAPLQTILATAPEKRTPGQQAALEEHYLFTRDPSFSGLVKKISELEAERQTIKARGAVTHIQKEKPNSAAMANILMRGEYDKPGEQVGAATPTSLHAMPEGAPANRLGLARWLLDPANPLTARVTVNRFWQEVFGTGIVVTAEDFGVMGSLPSHPMLLDWLAIEFRESGWDVKAFFKMMLMSATYRQSAVTSSEKLEKDRDNLLLSRGPRFRMDAEMVRDYALAASGILSRTMYGPGTKPYQPEGIWDVVGLPSGNTRKYVQDTGDNLYRRTLYNFWKRMAPPPSLDAFNAPSREFCTVRRERTNTPLQALVTLNDPQYVEAARFLAENALQQGGDDDSVALDYIARRVLCRPLRDQEQAIVLASKKKLLDYYQSSLEDARALIAVGASKASEKLDVTELAAWTMVCNQLMNLDEVLNK